MSQIKGVYHATAPTVRDGQNEDVQLDANGSVKTTQATLLAGEDLTNDVSKVEQRFNLLNVTADTPVASGAGFLHSITVSCTDTAPTAGTIIIYDNTAESGTILQTIYVNETWFAPFTLIFDGEFNTGLYVGFTTTNDVNVTVSYR